MPRSGYHLLDSKEDVEISVYERGKGSRHRWSTMLRLDILLSTCLLISLLANLMTAVRSHGGNKDIGRSPYSLCSIYLLKASETNNQAGGLGYDVPTVYRAHTDYWGENETLSNELWEAIDTSPMGVALTREWASEHDLPEAGPFPWDDSRETYYVKAFHQLHCLVSF